VTETGSAEPYVLRKAASNDVSAVARIWYVGWADGHCNQRARSFYSRLGWRDPGPVSYLAETEAGPLPVPSHRYEIDLTERVL
jgi:hypothetical protein